MANKLPYVRIQSNINICVTCGLQNQDVTDVNAHIPDRLKVNPLWPKATVLIRKGAGVYPSEIVEWPTVKSLAKDKVLTIGEFVADGETTEEKASKAKLEASLKEIKTTTQSLADLAK